MNFAYLDARGLLESVLAPPPEPIDVIPWETEERWREFGLTLAKFKAEYTRKHAELTSKTALLRQTREEVDVIRMIIDNVNSTELKERLLGIVQEYENANNVEELKQECGELAGMCNGMKEILLNTGADRYGKFTCFVCMDQLVDLCMNPCGHVMCERCWANTRDKSACPGCRQHINSVCKIYTM